MVFGSGGGPAFLPLRGTGLAHQGLVTLAQVDRIGILQGTCSDHFRVQLDIGARISTWNTRAILGNQAVSNPVVAGLKRRGFLQLIGKDDIVCLQETHGLHGSEVALSNSVLGSHSCWFNPGVSHGAGGTLVLVRNAWMDSFTYVWACNLVVGRVQVIHFLGPSQHIVLINLHIVPLLSLSEKKEILKSIQDYLLYVMDGITFVVGDFNYELPDESDDGMHGSLHMYFKTCFPELQELYQEEGTRLGPTRLSRLDRIYTNLSVSSLMDLDVSVCVAWRHVDVLGGASDHVPVVASLYQAKADNLKRNIPGWISFHPRFQSLCAQLWSECKKPANPFECLLLCKDVFKEVAAKVKSIDIEPELALNIHVRAYWALVAYRRCRTPNSRSVARALRAYPYLRTFFLMVFVFAPPICILMLLSAWLSKHMYGSAIFRAAWVMGCRILLLPGKYGS